MKRAAAGFTVVELVVVMILLGILSITAIPLMVKPSTFTPATLAQALLSQARFAAHAAVVRRGTPMSLRLLRDTGQWRLQVLAAGAAEQNAELDLHNSSVQVQNAATTVVLAAADTLNINYAAGGAVTSADAAGTVLDPALGIGLLIQGDSNRNLCIYPNGYVSARACL